VLTANVGAMPMFVVTMVNGPNWDAAHGRREQTAWDEHAAFMDTLVADKFVVLGGPIGDGEDVLLVIDALDVLEISQRMRADPWTWMGLLQIGDIRPWTVWLDGRSSSS
jgi:uncharacterized protein YciI